MTVKLGNTIHHIIYHVNSHCHLQRRNIRNDNDLNKVVQTQVIFKFWSTDGFGPKTFKYLGP